MKYSTAFIVNQTWLIILGCIWSKRELTTEYKIIKGFLKRNLGEIF